MKIKVIDLLNAKYENRIKEGFRFVLQDKVYQARKNEKEVLVITLPNTNKELSDNYYLENILNKEIEILTPGLIENINNPINNNYVCATTKITKEDINNILQQSVIETEKYIDKTTIVKATLPNGFVIVESSSCVDPSNFDMAIGKEICMKKIEDKIWELEGYKLQSELNRG